MYDREEWVKRTFVELADTLAADFDIIDFTALLVERCVDLLSPAEVGLALSPAHGRLEVIASSSERMHMLELIEQQQDEGPCRDCLHDGQPVLNQRLTKVLDRWPRFAQKARDYGFELVHALPLQRHGDVIGVLNIFSEDHRALSSEDASLAQALADTATIGILQERAISHGNEVADQLQYALDSRLVIEQAKGMVSEGRQVELDIAFAMLLRHARTNRLRLRNVAHDVISRLLPITDLQAVPPKAGKAPGAKLLQ